MSLLCSLRFHNKNSRTVSAVAREQSFLPSALTNTATGSKAFTMSDIKVFIKIIIFTVFIVRRMCMHISRICRKLNVNSMASNTKDF
ncbi:conserved hypothetical protein [Trichinella spiralis]|uniref:hypothetical protein n=1 Tax=Trichinella spiralis TaxID=6334 RepID=UPI0001EFB866|nr:conserved hypothetical protein [Trichinella spiralis]